MPLKVQFKLILLFFILQLVFGCASTKSPSQISYKKEYKAYTASEEIEHDRIDLQLKMTNKSTINLHDVLYLTLKQNPGLKIAAWDVRSKNHLVDQSKLWENSEIEIGLENFGAKTYSINLTQKIELGGKRASRIALAKSTENISAWDYEVKRLEIIIDASKQFLNSLKIQKIVNFLNDSIKLAEESLKLAEMRYKAGAGTIIDVIRA